MILLKAFTYALIVTLIGVIFLGGLSALFAFLVGTFQGVGVAMFVAILVLVLLTFLFYTEMS